MKKGQLVAESKRSVITGVVEESGPIMPLLNSLAQLVQQLQQLHQSGQFHGNIGLQTIYEDADGNLSLASPSPTITFGSSADADYPPDLDVSPPVTIPTQLAECRDILKQRGIAVDPVRIDLFQVGAFVCRRVCGESSQSYLSSPKTLSRVPDVLRPLIDGALGVYPERTFATADEIATAIHQALSSCSPEHHGNDSCVSAGAPIRTEAPSSLPEARSVADTAVGREKNLRANDPDVPFDRLGHYEIIRRIGRGGMGDVYLGYEPELDRQVAIKVLPREFAREPGFVDRFRREAATAARLSHPNIVQVFFAGEDAGHLFFTMQYVDGESLSELMSRRESLGIDHSVALIQQALSGLAHAHQQGMVHRDIKPGNLLIDHRLHRALLADFGLVKSMQGANALTATGTVMGTAEYMSPEQGRGLAVDHRSDLYSLGVMMYQMLSGQLPFAADDASALIFQHVYEIPKPLAEVSEDVPPGLSNIIDRLMAKNPDDRFATADEVLAVLKRFQDGATTSIPSVDLIDRATPQPVDHQTNRSGQESGFVQSPQFMDTPALPHDLEETVRPAWWLQLRQRVWSALGKAAPELHDRLLNTQQQVDGAVHEYERRRNVLLGFLSEAEGSLRTLKQQQNEWRRAEADADQQLALDLDAQATRETQEARNRSLRAIDELQREIDAQQTELHDAEIRLAQVTFALDRLRSQRDLLNARLKVAQARAQMHGRKASDGTNPRRQVIGIIAISGGLVIVAAVFVLKALRNDIRAPSNPPDPLVVMEPPSGRSRPGDTNRFPGTYLFGQEQDLDFVGTCLAFDPNNSNQHLLLFAIGGGDGAVRRGGVSREQGGSEANKIRTRYLGHRKAISALTYGPGSSLLASGDVAGEIRIWDISRDGQDSLYRVLTGHTSEISLLRFNSDASKLFSASADGDSIRLWDVLAERELSIAPPNFSNRAPFCWSPGQQRVIFAPDLADPDGVGMWGQQEGISVQFSVSELTEMKHTSSKSAAHVAHRHNMNDFRSIESWNRTDPESIATTGNDIRLTALAADRQSALTATTDNSLVLWNLQTGAEIARLVNFTGDDTVPNPPRFISVTFSPDGRHAATTTKDQGLQFWKLPELPMPRGQVRQYDMFETVNTVRFSPDGTSVAVGGRTGIKFWDLDRGKAYFHDNIVTSGQPVTSVIFTRDGRALAYGTGLPRSENSFLTLQTLRRWQHMPGSFRSNRKSEGHTDTITGAALLANNTVLLSGSRDATLRFWSVETGLETDAMPIGVAINSIAVSPDERRLLVATDKNAIIVIDLESKSEIALLTGHSFLVHEVNWSPDGTHFVSASADRTVRVWDAETLQTVHVLKGHEDHVNSAVLLNYGQFAVSGSEDATVRFWDVAAEEEIAVLEGHTGPVFSVDVDPFGTQAVSGSLDRTVRVWNLDTLKRERNKNNANVQSTDAGKQL